MFNSLDKTGGKMEDACKFVERIVEHADAVELLLLSKVMKTRLQTLKDEMPQGDMAVKIEVECDVEKFTQATQQFFCSFKKNNVAANISNSDAPVMSSASLMLTTSIAHPSASSLSLPSQINGNSNNNASALLKPHFDNFDVDRFKLLENTAGINMPSAYLSSAPLSEMVNTTSNVGLLNFERSLSRNSYSPTISDSGVDVSATANQQTLIQQLLKSGQLGINAQGSNIHTHKGCNKCTIQLYSHCRPVDAEWPDTARPAEPQLEHGTEWTHLSSKQPSCSSPPLVF